MKKLTAMLLAVLMMLSLTGCNLADLLGRKDNPSNNYDADGFTGNNDEDYDYDSDYNAANGIGDTVETYFFDFRVDDAYLTHELGDYSAEDGYQMLVVELMVRNTFHSEITMYDTDFQIQWGDGDEDYGWPMSDLDMEGILPEAYGLASGERTTGYLVFTVPQDCEDFAIAYLEEFDDDTTGDVHFVYFTAAQADRQPA